MWILPKSLISVSVADTEESTLDLDAASQACERLLMRRSKRSQSSSYLREWKAGRLMRLLSGLICDPSRGRAFETAWTSSLEVIPASHSAQPVSDSEQTTSGTSGLPSQMAFGFCDQESVSSRTSKGTSLLDCEKSLQNWKDSVTARRGAYSVRLKSAHRTSESGCSSWPTIRASEYKGCGPLGSKSHSYRVSKFYLDAVAQERTGATGRLNPSWCEWLMGVPIGWTECVYWGTE
jgi:hypothetical protein